MQERWYSIEDTTQYLEMEWLQMMKEYISTSFYVDVADLYYTPFDSKGGRENEALVA